MIKTLLLILLTIAIATPVNAGTAKVYVWRNEKGELVYSDTFKPGSEEVITKPDNVIKLSTSVETQVLDINKKVIKEEYQVLINIPKNNSTIRDNTGSIYIQGTIKPIFKRGLTIQLVLDGEPYQAPQTDTRFSLRNINRGEHQIKMQLLNEKGKVIASSDIITFYMHRASVN
ncbi:DUF4124 domain-containing protein [Colwellia sp. KU-HH00111]|uniref:DUF4124 domain-containing protein n=1 Tax=Colwellia sp. KU-HH00111 TaxID=3127652 RepID=UPI00310738CD